MSSEPDDSGQVRPAADPLDEALEETFPASDPVAIGHSDHAARPRGIARRSPSNGSTTWRWACASGAPASSSPARTSSASAAEFDPQPYHLDEEAAERTPLKAWPPPGGTPPPSSCG